MERKNLATGLRQSLFRIGCSLAVIAFAARGQASAADQQGSKGGPTAASLIETVFANEAWLDQARSFYMRTKQMQKLLDTEICEADGSRRFKAMVIETTFAWDEQRVLFIRAIERQSVDRRIWNGSLAVEHHVLAQDGNPRQQYVFDSKPDRLFGKVFDYGQFWANARSFSGPQPWWHWQSPAAPRGLAGEFVLAARRTYEGDDCYVVESPKLGRRFFVRVNDGRLVGGEHLVDRLTARERLALASEIAGVKLETYQAWNDWLRSQPSEEQAAIARRFEAACFARFVPWTTESFSDFREVARGRFVPMKRHRVAYKTEDRPVMVATATTETAPDERKLALKVGEPWADCHFTVEEIRVDEPLDDALFAIDLEDGITVSTDWRYDPPIRYTYRRDQPESERAALADREREKRNKSQTILAFAKSSVDSRLGKKPPSLPGEGWINTEPLKWEQLQGRKVMLFFWSNDCGPCHHFFEILNRRQESAKEDEAVYLAIHEVAARPDIEQAVAKAGLQVPVLIDSPLGDSQRGRLFDWFRVTALPYVVLIDRQGKVADHDVGVAGNLDIWRRFGEMPTGTE